MTIYDSLDDAGNGNVRFRGTLDSALAQFAREMQARDEVGAELKAALAEIDRLQVKLGGR